jgi:hypothetical protein
LAILSTPLSSGPAGVTSVHVLLITSQDIDPPHGENVDEMANSNVYVAVPPNGIAPKVPGLLHT